MKVKELIERLKGFNQDLDISVTAGFFGDQEEIVGIGFSGEVGGATRLHIVVEERND